VKASSLGQQLSPAYADEEYRIKNQLKTDCQWKMLTKDIIGNTAAILSTNKVKTF
jgi:hypothetical protein